MQNFIGGDPSTIEYWNERTRKIKDSKDVLFIDPRREEYWVRAREELRQWNYLRVADICCGYGQFASLFRPDKYVGIDFSEEMVKLAEQKNPGYDFALGDIRTMPFSSVRDIIFEVNSLHSLKWTPEQFFERFKPFAKVAVACLEADQFIIYQVYEKGK